MHIVIVSNQLLSAIQMLLLRFLNFRRTLSTTARFCRLLVCASGLWTGMAQASDWPQFLGPARNGTYRGNDLASVWPKEGPPKLWDKKVGQGFSGPVVMGGKLVLFHRLEDKEIIECLEANTGKQVWRFDYPTSYKDDFGFDEGPRATPTIAEGKVYCFGAEGALHCLDFATGKRAWSTHVKEQFASTKGFFGMACSPLVEGGNVLLNIGGANGAGIAAFDGKNGKLVWKATEHEAGYSSPVGATINSVRYSLFFTRSGLAILEPDQGKVFAQFPWRARLHASVNAATPLVIDNLIFLSASYQTGAILLRWDGKKLQKVWSSADSLSNHYATSVHRAGLLYGFHGRQEEGPSLRCIELQTGKVRWSHEPIPAGTITLADEFLLLLLEDGRLILAPASPKAFRPIAEAQILPFGVRAHPALADGRLYARSKERLICLDLGKR